jgi:hypothetical protein
MKGIFLAYALALPMSLLLLAGCATPIDNSLLEREVASLRSEVDAAVRPILITDADWQVEARGDLFVEVFRRLNALPLSQRTLSFVQSGTASGYVARGSANGVDYFVEIWPDRQVVGQVEIFGTHATWLQSGALQLSVDLGTRAYVPLHGHADPGPGGGAGTYVGTSGNARGVVTGIATLRQLTSGRVQYELEAAQPSQINGQVCIGLRHIGDICREISFDPRFGGAKGEFDLGGEITGAVEVPGSAPIPYVLRVHDATLTTGSEGIKTHGRVTIEWQRENPHSQ